MTIKDKLKLSATVSILLVVALCAVFLLTLDRVSKEDSKVALTIELMKNLYELATARDEYLLHHEERSRLQWHTINERFVALINQADGMFSRPAEKAILRKLRYNDEHSVSLFSRISAIRDRRGSVAPVAAQTRDVEAMFASQLLLMWNDQMSATLTLRDISKAALASAQNRAIIIAFILIVVVVSIVAKISLSISRLITGRIAKLQEGADMVGRGNLNHVIGLTENDELGKLARSFDEMTTKLGRSYQELEKEITERKKAEEAQGLLAAIVEISEDAIIGKDLNGIIQTWNVGAERIFGYTAEDIIGRNISVLVPPGHHDEVPDILKRITRDEHIEHFETVRMRKDGTIIPVSLTFSAIKDGSGRIVGASKIAHDITDRKRVEEALQKSYEELEVRVRERTSELALANKELEDEMVERQKKEKEVEEKNAELERFAYTVSHDLKSPLVTVKTFLGYLEKDMHNSDDARVGQDIGYIHTAADKMGHLLDELLEMSRIGRVVNTPVNVSFRDLVEEGLNAVAGRISERGVEVKVYNAGISLYGDRQRLAEIWQNLIENAVKYMGDQKSPRIEVGTETLETETVFFVRDNGIGIDPRHIKKIFGLFEKLDPKTEGTGLGLALVKRIITMYDGTIWVESDGPGKGTCVRFTLPEAIIKQIIGENT